MTNVDTSTPTAGENVELAERVLRHVIANPDRHEQELWLDSASADAYRDHLRLTHTVPRPLAEVDPEQLSCPTTACLAGWTLTLAGGEPGSEGARRSLAEGLLRIVADNHNSWRGVLGSVTSDLWTQRAAELLGVTHPDRIAELKRVFMTSDYRNNVNVRAARAFAQLFYLDYDAIVRDVRARVVS